VPRERRPVRYRHAAGFMVLENRKPCFALECKASDRDIGPAVRCFAEPWETPRFYRVHRGRRHFESGKVTVLPFTGLCEELGMPSHSVATHSSKAK
jgi:hypothetical protein